MLDDGFIWEAPSTRSDEVNNRLVRTVLTVLALSIAGVGLAACNQHGRGDRHGWNDRYDRDGDRDRDRDRDRRGWDYRR
jgi:Ni/Co efflux regulator RcnB